LVKVVSRESWAVLFPGRIYRSLRFRELGEERPFASLRHRVEHEALCALKAHSDGVPTPRLAVVTHFPHDAMLLAFDAPQLRSITELEPHERGADLLAKVWQTVVALRKSHTVHHRLNGDFLMFDDHCNVVLFDFSAAELGATERAMSSDVAEVLAITAARLGVETAVAAAVEAIGPDAVAFALPRLQPLALTRSTRAAVKEVGCLDELKEEVQRVTGATSRPIEDLERIKPRTVITVVMAALGLWVLVPQVLGAGDVWGSLRTADWQWAVAALGLSAITYLGAAVALDGSVPERLPLGPNLGVQFATSFVGVAAPGGGLALTARFLQRRGIDPAVSVAAVGVDTAAGVMVHFSLLGVFIAWAGTSGLKTFHLPPVSDLALIAVGVGLAATIIVAVPRTRRLLAAHVVPPVRRAAGGIAETARHPSNLVELFGGSAAITLGYLLALQVSVWAFGAGPAFTSVALVYLVGSIVSSVAPTPGGIGAVEATLVAGLTSAGMRSDTALGAVLLYRGATFWLPLVPGWLAFTMLQRTGDL
jgi:glycosyltransferase 2 family protein